MREEASRWGGGLGARGGLEEGREGVSRRIARIAREGFSGRGVSVGRRRLEGESLGARGEKRLLHGGLGTRGGFW